MNNQNSIQAYFNLANQKKYQTEKAMIARALLLKPNQSRFNLGRRLGINDIEVQRRLSDMKRDGEVQVTGNRKHGVNTISLYSLTEQLQMFTEKKPTFQQWAENNRPDWIQEYKSLVHHEL